MKQLIKIIFLSILIGFTCPTIAQKYRPLGIGEDMPDIEFRMMNYPNEKTHVSDFKGKLLLLDFWATWCSSCINQFPKMDSLQQVYKDQLQVILVNCKNTRDNEVRIKEFLEKRRELGLTANMAIAMLDVDADLLFPHKEIPHYVWIGPDGRFKSVTGPSEVTGQNIQAILDKQQIRMVQKKDFSADRLMDIGQGDLPIDGHLAYYSVFKRGKIEGLSAVNYPRQIERDGISYIRGKAMRNLSLFDMYLSAIYTNAQFREKYSARKFLLETKNTSKLIRDPATNKEAWEKENLYTYDLIVPTEKQDSIYNYMISDLNRYTDFYGRIEKRKIKCLALIKTTKADKIKTKGGEEEYKLYNEVKEKYIHNLPVSMLVWRLDRFTAFKLPIVDETGYKENIDIILNVNLDDATAIRKGLQQYGLDLVEKEKLMEVFVLSDKKYKNDK